MSHPYPDDRANAIERAHTYVSLSPLFLDTETTGLSDMEEICEIAIIDVEGNVLINSLVRPTKRIPPNVSDIHGITDELVANAPTFGDLLPRLKQILWGRTVLVYNRDFDVQKILRSAVANGFDTNTDPFITWWQPFQIVPGEQDRRWHCVMELYAQYYGDYNEYHNSYTWQRLSAAMLQCGLKLPPGIHRAHADAEMCRQIFLHVAAQEIPESGIQLDIEEPDDVVNYDPSGSEGEQP